MASPSLVEMLLAILSALLRVLLCLGCAYNVFLFSHRALLHPLASYPGPAAATLTDAYSAIHALRRRLHLFILEAHKTYGPVVRIAPNRLVFNTPAAVRDIYQNERITKSYLYLLSQQTPNTYNVFNAVPREVHQARRKLIGRVVNDSSMRKFESTMLDHVEIFVEQLRSGTTSSQRSRSGNNENRKCSINMTERCRYLGIDIATSLGFGQSLNLQTDPTYRFLLKSMDYGAYNGSVQLSFPFLAKLRTRAIMNIIFFKTRLAAFRKIESMINARLAQDKDAHHDLYSAVADSLGTGPEQIRQSDLWSEALFFLSAGGDTTSTAIAGAFFYLSRNHESYIKLSSEIRSTFASSSEIRNGHKLANCTYLRACIDESLRMSPPVTGTLWRELYAHEKSDSSMPFVVDGHVVPPGAQVGVNIYALHHNPEYFPEPFSYRPERWLVSADDSDGAKAKGSMKEAFIPFSTGPRGCAGKAMAYLETSLVLAKTLWHFDFSAVPGSLGDVGAGRKGTSGGRDRVEEFQLYDTFGANHNGPYLEFIARDE